MPQRQQKKSAPLKQLPTNDHIDKLLWISFREDPAQSVYPVHGHAWGEFVYAFNGVMEVNINQIDYLTPPPYGIWLPPNVAHSSLNRTDVSHGTLYIHESLCTHLPQQAGIMLSSPLVSALFKHLSSVHDKFHRTLILSGFCLLKIAKISLNSSFFPKPIKR